MKDERVKDCPDCKVLNFDGEEHTLFCQKHMRFGELRTCANCGSTELIEYPEDPRYLVCADCGTLR